MSFLSRAWRDGVILDVVGIILREWLVGKINGHLVIFVRIMRGRRGRGWWWWRQRRKVIPEDGWIDDREEFIGKKGLGMDGGGR